MKVSNVPQTLLSFIELKHDSCVKGEDYVGREDTEDQRQSNMLRMTEAG